MSLIADPRIAGDRLSLHKYVTMSGVCQCVDFAGFDPGCFSLFDSGAGLIVILPCMFFLLAKVVVLRKSQTIYKTLPCSSLLTEF